MAKVELKKVTKKYPGQTDFTIKPLDLFIKDKEFMILVGPSGCGKTTTLRMIAGLEEVTSGEIYIGDRLVNDVSPKDRDIAMVFQNYALYPHMNVYDNMAFGLKLRGVPKSEIDKRVLEAARILGIEDYLNRKPRELSGGQRQRVALGRAIVREPKVFLMDEPLSNLDAKLRVHMRAEIIKLHQKLQTTMIYVTHDQVEAMTMGDRIAVFNHGVIQQVGEPQSLYDKPANKFVAGFIGSPAMNFFNGKIIVKEEKFYFKGQGMEFKINPSFWDSLKGYVNKEVILGIRPEHIALDYLKKFPVDENIIGATTVVVEPMGAEYFITMKVDENEFMIRVPPEAEPVAGKKENIVINIEKTHFFDPETEKRIT